MSARADNMTPRPSGRRIAVLRFSALGDVAMAVAPVYDLCLSNPADTVIFVTKAKTASLFVNAPANLQVVAADTDGEHKGIAGLMRLTRSLRADIVIDLHDVLRTHVIDTFAAMSGANVRIFDKARAAKRRLIARGADHAPAVSPTVSRYRDAFSRAGLNATPRTRSVFDTVPPDDTLYASLTPPPAPGEKWIGIAPFAAHPGKIYPLHLMEQVVERLAEIPGVRPVFFGGGPKETPLLRDLAAKTRGICVAGSGIGFNGELALMSRLAVMLCMDSGNMHLAHLAGTPTVSVWGATHPAAGFCPPATVAIGADLPCRPCSVFGNKPCRRRDLACMTAISPDAITAAIIKTANLNEHSASV